MSENIFPRRNTSGVRDIRKKIKKKDMFGNKTYAIVNTSNIDRPNGSFAAQHGFVRSVAALKF